MTDKRLIRLYELRALLRFSESRNLKEMVLINRLIYKIEIAQLKMTHLVNFLDYSWIEMEAIEKEFNTPGAESIFDHENYSKLYENWEYHMLMECNWPWHPAQMRHQLLVQTREKAHDELQTIDLEGLFNSKSAKIFLKNW